ncbi:MAG TPA: hypothetical protein VGF45_23305 [Polyangia bacterium]
MSKRPEGNGKDTVVGEPLEAPHPEQVAHLAANRLLIIKRSLLSSALGGVIPIPVVDEYVAGRVRAGLFLRLAEQRRVDLLPSSAELMGDPREGSTLRHATITAFTLVALKLAWRKFFALLAVGRGAEEMATTFQFATLFDHYCSKVHVGGSVDRERAARLRRVIHDTIAAHEKVAIVGAFREGSKILAKTALEAPSWVQKRLQSLAQRWVSSRGDVDATLNGGEPNGEANQWLDRASAEVDVRLSPFDAYMHTLISDFERRWRASEEEAQAAAEKAAAQAATKKSSSLPS